MAENNKSAPVIAVARELRFNSDEPQLLSTGVRARLKSVSATLIDSVTSRIVDPPIPRVYIEEKGREMANPDDPDYQAALAENQRLRGLAALDAIIMFGVELADPVPADGKWLERLRFMEKRGLLSLAEYNLDDPMELEFVYKRLVAVSPADIERLNRMNRISPEDTRRVEDSF